MLGVGVGVGERDAEEPRATADERGRVGSPRVGQAEAAAAAAMSASDATFDWAEATLGPSIPLMSVVTWNCSPAPSQSDAVTIGVLTYWKPCCWKKVCVAYASWFLTRVTAPMVFAAEKFSAAMKASPRVTRVVDYLFAGVFSAFALKILTAQAK